jgi:hypothetical protein
MKRRLIRQYKLLWFIHVRLLNQQAINVVALYQNKFGHACFNPCGYYTNLRN